MGMEEFENKKIEMEQKIKEELHAKEMILEAQKLSIENDQIFLNEQKRDLENDHLNFKKKESELETTIKNRVLAEIGQGKSKWNIYKQQIFTLKGTVESLRNELESEKETI